MNAMTQKYFWSVLVVLSVGSDITPNKPLEFIFGVKLITQTRTPPGPQPY